MAYEVNGKIAAIYDTVQRTESFRTREFVIEKSDDIGGRVITNYIKFQSVQDKTAILDKVKIGDEVKVHFNLKGTRWVKDGRENYITNLDAWRIEPVLAVPAANHASTEFDPNEMQVSNDITGDDLPF
jgi:hypothetical protein